ncbi:integration host factor subunit alpha [Caedimonas varicaedens]|uniref:Integration host factor subunit alpha n=1 Tax=Caedimonas varicaedens TaxID=1629334 RepID=A0A0K8MAU3_9PROT|nr:integration host factor subunit alpha [Caedimonas varicaedens]
MSDTLIRRSLAEHISEEMGLSFSKALPLIDLLFDQMIEGIVRDERLTLPHFGTFRVLSKKERLGRNPRTKKVATISARKRVSFKASQKVKLSLEIQIKESDRSRYF